MLYNFFRRVVRPFLKKPFLITTFSYSYKEEFFDKVMSFTASAQKDASPKNPKLGGDYLEFGVYRGDSFTIAYRYAKKHELKSMRFYAFDSFQGMPVASGRDAQYQMELGVNETTGGHLSCSVDEFLKICEKKNLDVNDITIVPGYYDEILKTEFKGKNILKKAAVIMIDCDWYESTVPVLHFIKDLIQEGTVIIFDEWFGFKGNPNWGEQKAFNEWLEQNSDIFVTQYHKYGPWGNSFIIHVK